MRSLTYYLACGAVCAAWVLSALPATAQNTPLWVRELGTAGNERWSGVATDPVNNHINVAGHTGGSIGANSQGSLDALVARYTTVGTLVWTRQFGTSGVDKLYGAATDAQRSVLVSGYTEGALGGPQRGLFDPIIAKYNYLGSLRWLNHELGSAGEDLSTAIATDNNLNVFATGWAEGPIVPTATYQGGRDAWVAKFNRSGRLQWATQIGTAALDAAYGVATDADGNVFVGGTTRGSLFGPITDTDGGFVYGDAFVAKYNGATGALMWGRQFGTNAAEVVYGTATDSLGNVVVSGRVDGALFVTPRLGDQDLFVAKYDGSGNFLWGRQFGTSASDNSTGVAVDGNNNVIVGGHSSGSLAATSQGGRDMVVRKYDPNGNIISTRQIGTAGGDFEWDVAADNAGNIIIVGESPDSLAGQPFAGDSDAVVVKFAP